MGQTGESLPSRERVLKRPCACHHLIDVAVAPFAGACVETGGGGHWQARQAVAPFAGACVETL